MRLNKILLTLVLFITKFSLAQSDSLYQKSCEVLLIDFSANVEKYAKTDMVFFNQFYVAKQATHQPLMLEIGEITGTASEVYLIDFSKIIVGENVYFKDWGKDCFSIFFSKEICIKKRNQKNKKFEILFATDKADRKTDYHILANDLKRDLEVIERHCKQ